MLWGNAEIFYYGNYDWQFLIPLSQKQNYIPHLKALMRGITVFGPK